MSSERIPIKVTPFETHGICLQSFSRLFLLRSFRSQIKASFRIIMLDWSRLSFLFKTFFSTEMIEKNRYREKWWFIFQDKNYDYYYRKWHLYISIEKPVDERKGVKLMDNTLKRNKIIYYKQLQLTQMLQAECYILSTLLFICKSSNNKFEMTNFRDYLFDV